MLSDAKNSLIETQRSFYPYRIYVRSSPLYFYSRERTNFSEPSDESVTIYFKTDQRVGGVPSSGFSRCAVPPALHKFDTLTAWIDMLTVNTHCGCMFLLASEYEGVNTLVHVGITVIPHRSTRWK